MVESLPYDAGHKSPGFLQPGSFSSKFAPVHKDGAVLFQADPLSAEIGLRDNLFHLGRSTMSGAIESFDFGPSVEVEGKKYTKAEPTTGHAIPLFLIHFNYFA